MNTVSAGVGIGRGGRAVAEGHIVLIVIVIGLRSHDLGETLSGSLRGIILSSLDVGERGRSGPDMVMMSSGSRMGRGPRRRRWWIGARAAGSAPLPRINGAPPTSQPIIIHCDPPTLDPAGPMKYRATIYLLHGPAAGASQIAVCWCLNRSLALQKLVDNHRGNRQFWRFILIGGRYRRSERNRINFGRNVWWLQRRNVRALNAFS